MVKINYNYRGNFRDAWVTDDSGNTYSCGTKAAAEYIIKLETERSCKNRLLREIKALLELQEKSNSIINLFEAEIELDGCFTSGAGILHQIRLLELGEYDDN